MPDDIREDTANSRYTTIHTPRIGQQTEETWKIKMEFSGNANDGFVIAGWTHNKASAGDMLEKSVREHVEPHEQRNNIKIRTSTVRDADFVVKSCAYVIPEDSLNGSEKMWYWWDIKEVKLEPLKSYGIQKWEKGRAEDMKDREKEGLDMVRKSMGEVTEQERAEIEQRNERMRVVSQGDRNDADIIGGGIKTEYGRRTTRGRR
jgi:hypothetical protein